MKLRLAASGENEYGTWKRFESVMTNADKIRAMSDEKLAWFYAKKIASCYGCEASTMEDCAKCWLDWLKKEVDT